ncbi:MAG: helix-turn-helix domain-containing protein [Candidatus Bathyarchaeota archaeon]|nr:MAG: helix-turn-helix domain-containing protein [Candidatus Bathyarchaeota archaeon]
MNKLAEVLHDTELIFRKAGFQVSERCTSRPSCFDLVTKKGKKLVFVKVHDDVGNVSTKDASEVQAISECFTATPLFISDKTRKKPLEDDTVYSRCNICTVTLKTLEDIISHRKQPLIEAGPGGYYVRLNGEAIRKKRLELGLSVGKLAEMMGVSRRTLYGYEKDMAKASVSAAYCLEWILGIPAARSINVFESPSQGTGFFATARRIITKHYFLQMVLKKFAQFNFDVAPTKRAPFDFIARDSRNSLNVVGGVPHKGEQNVDQRTEEIVSIGKIINAQPIFVTDGRQVPENGIRMIRSEDLEEIEHPEEFIAQF